MGRLDRKSKRTWQGGQAGTSNPEVAPDVFKEETMLTKRKCANCTYWEKVPRSEISDPSDWKGHCRRYPRRGVLLPAADPHDWCGEFKEKGAKS